MIAITGKRERSVVDIYGLWLGMKKKQACSERTPQPVYPMVAPGWPLSFACAGIPLLLLRNGNWTSRLSGPAERVEWAEKKGSAVVYLGPSIDLNSAHSGTKVK